MNKVGATCNRLTCDKETTENTPMKPGTNSKMQCSAAVHINDSGMNVRSACNQDNSVHPWKRLQSTPVADTKRKSAKVESR